MSTKAARALETGNRISSFRMTPTKWRLIRMFEALAQLVKPLIPPLSPVTDLAEPPARILVVEPWNMGDLAILFPFLSKLRKAFPTAKISLLLNSGLESLLEGQGLVDEFIPVRVPWVRHFHRWRKYNPFSLNWIGLARAILALHRRQFDWAFAGRMDVRDNFLLWLTGARRRIGYGFAGGGSFLTDCVAPDVTRPHRADLWLGLLDAVGVPQDRNSCGIRLGDEELVQAKAFLAKEHIPHDAFLIGIHPSARIATRRWGEDRFADVARRLLKETDAHILWFTESGSAIQPPCLERCHPVSLDFRRFLAVLSRCQLLVCNDSGPMHLANLLNIPVVAVFGPQRPEWYGPRGPKDHVVIRPEFSCRPCFDYCVFDQPYCLRAISVEEVYGAVQSKVSAIREPKETQVCHTPKVEWVSHV